MTTGLNNFSGIEATALECLQDERKVSRGRRLALLQQLQQQNAAKEREWWASLKRKPVLARLFCDPLFVKLHAQWEAVRGWARESTAHWAETLVDELTPTEAAQHREIVRRYSEQEQAWEMGLVALLRAHGLENWQAIEADHADPRNGVDQPKVTAETGSCHKDGAIQIGVADASTMPPENPTLPMFRTDVARKLCIDVRTLKKEMRAGRIRAFRISKRLFLFDATQLETLARSSWKLKLLATQSKPAVAGRTTHTKRHERT